MPHATCAHCGTAITDHSTLAERGGQVFCCNNCAQMISGIGQQGSGRETCAHCQILIADTSTQVVRDGQTFCCGNCAAAMPRGAGRQASS